jgi:hypothetical protein
MGSSWAANQFISERGKRGKRGKQKRVFVLWLWRRAGTV